MSHILYIAQKRIPLVSETMHSRRIPYYAGSGFKYLASVPEKGPASISVIDDFWLKFYFAHTLRFSTPIIVHQKQLHIFKKIGLKYHPIRPSWSIKDGYRFRNVKSLKGAVLLLDDHKKYPRVNYYDDWKKKGLPKHAFISLIVDDYRVKFFERNQFYAVYSVGYSFNDKHDQLFDFKEKEENINYLFDSVLYDGFRIGNNGKLYQNRKG